MDKSIVIFKKSIEKNTQQAKMEFILKELYKNQVFIDYDFFKISEDTKKELGQYIEKNYFQYIIDSIGIGFKGNIASKLLGTEKRMELNKERSISELGQHELKAIYLNQEELYQKGFIQDIAGLNKEQILLKLKEEIDRSDRVKLIYYLAYKQNIDFSDEDYIFLFSDKYKNEFAEIELNNNPLFSSNLMKCLENVSPMFDSNDLVNNSDSLEEQRKIIIEIIEILHKTGGLETLINNTEKKANKLNAFLENKVDFIENKSTNLDEQKIQLIERINNLDFNNKNDKVEFGVLLRHILNKFTKDIEAFENDWIYTYIDINDEFKSVVENFDKEREKFFAEIEEFLINPLTANSEMAKSFRKNNPKGGNEKDWIVNEIKGIVRRKFKNDEIKDRRKGLRIIPGTEINFSSNKDIDERLIKNFLEQFQSCVKNSDKPEKLEAARNELRAKLSEYIKIDSKVKQEYCNYFIQGNSENLKRTYDKYKKLPRGTENLNEYPTFSEIIRKYLNYVEKNNETDSEKFAELVLGFNAETIRNTPQIRDFLENMKNTIEEIKNQKFLIDENVLIYNISRFLEKKEKIYNLKHLTTVQLYNLYQKESLDMIFMGNLLEDMPEKENPVIDISVDGFLEVFGGHYVGEGTKEEEIVRETNKLPSIVSQMYRSRDDRKKFSIAKVYIPFLKLTEKQKKEFQEVYKIIEEVDSLSDAEINDENLSWLANKQNTENSKTYKMYQKVFEFRKKEDLEEWNALKVQFLLGAGIDKFQQRYLGKSKQEEKDRYQEVLEQYELLIRELGKMNFDEIKSCGRPGLVNLGERYCKDRTNFIEFDSEITLNGVLSVEEEMVGMVNKNNEKTTEDGEVDGR